MRDAVASLLDAYARAEPRRAAGGIYAMAGFAFQAEVAISQAVTCLVASNDFGKAGKVFVEALSDVAVRGGDGALILFQVKRTLTAATLDSAADEVAAIEAVDLAQPQPVRPSYGLVCQHRRIDLDWARLPSASPHFGLVKRLLTEGRLQVPQQQPNPRWQALAALWSCHSDPFEFLRFALDRILHRGVDAGDAAACWEALAERFRQGRMLSPDSGQRLDAADVLASEHVAQQLEVGKRVTWDRWRRGQYMLRPVLAGDVVARAVAAREQALHSPVAELSVCWLAGRSGAGKSVVLLNAVSDLVQAGHSVLWLKPEELEPALARIARGGGWDSPDFLAIDDIFDPDARDRVDLGRISILVDEQGARHWPVLLTCGPSEFADDFAEQSRYQGFSVQTHEVPLLDRAETERFVAWAMPHLGTAAPDVVTDPWSGLALSQSAEGRGLFVSVATELASGDMRHFGQRFAGRLRSHGDEFVRRIRLCLAVNRLYLRAPATWLSSEDRAHLEDINRDGDFALEAAETGQDWLRLTHPHLSDAIYPHLLQPARPRLFAEDLGDAFQQALVGGQDALAQRLLQAFSAGGGQARAQRMQAVDEQRLAERCVQAWRAHPPGGDIRLQAGMRVSLASWPVALAKLGRPLDELIADALQGIDQAEGQFAGLGWWPVWWTRLVARHPAHAALVDWAVSRLARSADAPVAAWSHVWEAMWHSTQGERRQVLTAAGYEWLRTQGHRADWHFVWKVLQGAPGADRQSLANLLAAGLPHVNAGHWAHVWQEALSAPPNGRDLPSLIAQGCDWLVGREDKDQWNYVWQALLARVQALPEGWSERRLVEAGCTWLAGREDKDQWTFVWEALLARVPAFPDAWGERRLVEAGCTWLAGREDKDQWKFVWEALLARVQALPEGWSERRLVEAGCTWLAGREDKDQWSFVWQALLDRVQALPEGWSERRLVEAGCTWLAGREDKDQWTFVWEALLARVPAFPDAWGIRQLVDVAIRFLGQVEAANGALPVLKQLLRHWQEHSSIQREAIQRLWGRWIGAIASMPIGPASHFIEALIDAGLYDTPGLRSAAVSWCERAPMHASWPLVVVKSLLAWPLEPALLAAGQRLAEQVKQHPNAGWLHWADALLGEISFQASPAQLLPLVGAIRSRKQSPLWEIAEAWLQTREVISAVASMAGRHMVAELPGGLIAALNPIPSKLRPGQSLDVVVVHLDRALDRIVCQPGSTGGDLPPVGHVVDAMITGHKQYGVFVKVGSATGLILPTDLPAATQEWQDLLPLQSRWKVHVIKHNPKGFNAVLVEPPWAGAGSPAEGQVAKATITGHAPYGVFVRIGVASGLILPTELPAAQETWSVLLPLRSRWMVQVLRHTLKGFNAALIDAPWAPIEPLAVGLEVEASITGFKDYGVFVQVGSRSGLIHKSALPVPAGQWPSALPLNSRWLVRVVGHAVKGFSAELVNPPWLRD